MAIRKSDTLSTLLTKRIAVLGEPNLRAFHRNRPSLGLSYELLRQVVIGGRIPRPETLLSILREMAFPPSQTKKILALCYGAFRDAGTVAGEPVASVDGTETRGRRISHQSDRGMTGQAGPNSGADSDDQVLRLVESDEQPSADTPAEIAGRLAKVLPWIPFRENADFWDLARHLLASAERKATEENRRQGGEAHPLLFGREPEAIYQYLVRLGRTPPFLSKGESIILGAADDGDTLRDRFRGALLGAAVGERFGAATQGLSARDIVELFGDGVLPAPPSLDLAPSFLPLLPLLNVHGSFPAKESAATFSVTLPVPTWPGDGIDEPSCLPALRAVPVALLRSTDFRRLKLDAGLLAASTHSHPLAPLSAILHAAAVARLLGIGAESLDPLVFIHEMGKVAGSGDPEKGARPRGAKGTSPLLRRIASDLPALILRQADPPECREILGNGPTVAEALPFGWACFLRNPNDFEGALRSVVVEGNAAQESGGFCGGLSGAYLGASAIPARLLDTLPERSMLEAYADDIFQRVTTPPPA